MKSILKQSMVLICSAMILSLFWQAKPSFAVPIGGKCSTADQCDDGLFCNGEEACVDHVCAYGSPVICDHGHLAGTPAYRISHCDENRDACVFPGEDSDGDGHDSIRAGGDDCADNDANRFPGNVEVCNYARGHDEDCDPTTVGFKDSDGDGYNDSKCFNTLGDHRYYDTRRH